MVDCKKTIWTGRFKDKRGIFEIIVPACGRDEAFGNIRRAVKDIKEEKKRFIKPTIEDEDMIYIEEVGDFDYIRE